MVRWSGIKRERERQAADSISLSTTTILAHLSNQAQQQCHHVFVPILLSSSTTRQSITSSPIPLHQLTRQHLLQCNQDKHLYLFFHFIVGMQSTSLYNIKLPFAYTMPDHHPRNSGLFMLTWKRIWHGNMYYSYHNNIEPFPC